MYEKNIYENIVAIKKKLNKAEFEHIKVFYNTKESYNPFYIKFPYVCFYKDDEKRDNFIYNIGKFKDDKLKDKSISLTDYLKKNITIHHYEKERSFDLYDIKIAIKEIETKKTFFPF